MTTQEYIDALRNYLKDYEGVNRLLNFKKENIDDDLNLYLNLGLGELNFVPPLIKTWGIENFPFPALLINQSTIECLISNGIVNARNELEYNNGGVVVKAPNGSKYNNAISSLMRRNAMMLQNWGQWKIKSNMEAAYGIVSSPYMLLEEGQYLHSII